MKQKAYISDCGKYRYTLTRIWQKELPRVLFVGLNPSTADGNKNDQTIRKLIGFCKTWGYGGFTIVNLFAYRSSNPKILAWLLENGKDPIGKENQEIIGSYRESKKYKLSIMMWGNNLPKGFEIYANKIRNILKNPHYFNTTKKGHPMHPLCLPYNTKLKKFSK